MNQEYEYGPCHFCGSETPEQHGRILVGCADCRTPSGIATVEICDECNALEDLGRCGGAAADERT